MLSESEFLELAPLEELNKNKIVSRLKSLFVLREDVYARQFLEENGKKAFKCVKEPLTIELLRKHFELKDFLGVYQLDKNSFVKWGCFDFDKNTSEDFENAKILFKNLKGKGFHPLIEKSGGGLYKLHIWVFSQEPITAKQMKSFLEWISKESKIKPNEIFPKQTEIKKEEFGNLVKLPLGIHLETTNKSIFLNDNFEEIKGEQEILDKLEFCFDNKDKIPEIQEQIKRKKEEIKGNPTIYDEFFNYVLETELPTGKVNDKILKNLAIWLYQKGYSFERLEQEIKPIYNEKSWTFSDLKGWFKATEKGKYNEIRKGEILKWIKEFTPEKDFLPKLLEDDGENVKVQDFLEFDEKGKIKRFLTQELGNYLLKLFHFKTIRGNDKQIFYYDEGYYKGNGIAKIKESATNILGSYFKINYIEELIHFIRNSSYADADVVNNQWINLKNGLLNPITREFIQHSPDIFCLSQLPIEYNSEAKCPLFSEKLKEKCDEDWKYDLVQEMFGYCFLKDNRFEKAFMLFGDNRTMKSTTLWVLEQLLGKENVTSMSLQHLSENIYAPAFLYGTYANICSDLSAKELSDTSLFLKVVGQDSITCGKKFEQEITFFPFSKLIFSCNIIPATKNKNLAFYRRWCPIEFNIQSKKIDIEMRNKLLYELSGILNWALVGLDRILKNNALTFLLSDLDVKDLYERNSDSVNSFIYTEINTENDEEELKKRDVYKKYTEYCKENKLTSVNQVSFGRKFFEITGCGSKRIGTIPAYSGVSYKKKGNVQGKLN